jgi:pyridoxal phosphate enzyme (YggS family)
VKSENFELLLNCSYNLLYTNLKTIKKGFFMNYQLRNKIDKIFQDIENSRKKVNLHHIVQIIAVTKYSTVTEIDNLYNIGQRAFGENKVQDFELKSLEFIDKPIEWHFIGNLQKNKINKLLSLKPALFQGLDSIKIAQEIQNRLQKKDENLNALLQINSSYEKTKSGVLPEKAYDIYLEISERFPNIKLQGLMTIGANVTDEVQIRKSFKITKNIFDKLPNNQKKILSMGMSKDFKIAIEEGSNLIRLGSILNSR